MTSSELFYEMETELLKNLVRYLSKGSVGSAQWQLDKLHEMGKLKSVNANTIAKYSREAIKEAEREIQRASIRGASVIDKASEGHTDKLNMAVPANADCPRGASCSITMPTWRRSAFSSTGRTPPSRTSWRCGKRCVRPAASRR